ncbi:hypothetical protein AOQ88_01105 [Candidatus Riesia sp. GBBU]|nr:hypothetical protein AOQ88_01105 [Candidatus Riesia sp. GBBU]
MYQIKHVRNFSIIAHVDHGKSTLSDQIMQICGGISKNKVNTRILDFMDLEKERGITIKARSVSLKYFEKSNNINYFINFIDTPGHIDFSFEVFNSLKVSDGVLLLIDASQGIQSQTIEHFNIAKKMNLKVIPVINKIDIPGININCIRREIEDLTKTDANDILICSAKLGIGIENIIKSIIKNIPYPRGKVSSLFQAKVIDSWFDKYSGIFFLVKIENGIVKKGISIKSLTSDQMYKVKEVGIFSPKKVIHETLFCGEIGWISCFEKKSISIKHVDTLVDVCFSGQNVRNNSKNTNYNVYSSLFPVNQDDFNNLESSLDKLNLNDSGFSYIHESSHTFGRGFRCGFFGTLHMEIVQERLKREHGANIVMTSPSITYKVELKTGKEIYINNPNDLTKVNNIKSIYEPVAITEIITTEEYFGEISSLCQSCRGRKISISFCKDKFTLIYEIPFFEIVSGFFSKIKSISSGYASFRYNSIFFKKEDIVCVYILINKKRIDVLSSVLHKKNSLLYARQTVKKLKEFIDRRQFDIVIQASIENRVVAKSIVKRLRKNVVSKCYGGDVNRKKKLLLKQKIGKKMMKKIGNIEFSQELLNSITVFFHKKK